MELETVWHGGTWRSIPPPEARVVVAPTPRAARAPISRRVIELVRDALTTEPQTMEQLATKTGLPKKALWSVVRNLRCTDPRMRFAPRKAFRSPSRYWMAAEPTRIGVGPTCA